MQSSFKYNLFEKCELLSLTEELASLPFHCGDSEREKDLEDFRSYPAVLLGRLGVNKKYQGSKRFVGLQVINYIKTWFIEEDNKTGCRFLVVDAYNQEKVLKFYERNHFKYLYVNEREERVALHIPENEEELYTRLMFLDLMYTEIMESPF